MSTAAQEYVLIGEADSGVCGHPWLTWGCAPDCQSLSDDTSDDIADDASSADDDAAPEYQHDVDIGRKYKSGVAVQYVQLHCLHRGCSVGKPVSCHHVTGRCQSHT